MDLSNATLYISLYGEKEKNSTGCLMHLSDYADYTEFMASCVKMFPGVSNPILHFHDWDNIPDSLISAEWISPNIFEIREALEHLEEQDWDYFECWCKQQGHDLATDDASQLMTAFLNIHGSSKTEIDSDLVEVSEDYFSIRSPPLTCNEIGINSLEVFDDNYN